MVGSLGFEIVVAVAVVEGGFGRYGWMMQLQVGLGLGTLTSRVRGILHELLLR